MSEKEILATDFHRLGLKFEEIRVNSLQIICEEEFSDSLLEKGNVQLIPPSQIPEFVTARLRLTAVTEKDIPAYEKYFVDYEVIRHLSAVVPWPYPDGGVREHIVNKVLPKQGKSRWVWGIFLHENPAELIGVVDLWRPGTPENRGFWLGRQFWGRGIMTEAVKPVMDYAFDELGFERLVFSNAKGNDRSARVKEKTGARLLRVEPTAMVDPIYTESEIWELTKEEWHASQGR